MLLCIGGIFVIEDSMSFVYGKDNMRSEIPFLTHIYEVFRPTYSQKKELRRLQRLFFTPFDEGTHRVHLEYLYTTSNARLSSATRLRYENTGTSWRRLGFTQENPRLDIKDSGELGLRCLVYFFKTQKRIALKILNSRIRRDDFDERQYPWATIGIKLCAMLASMFEIVDPTNDTMTDCQQFHLQPFWHFFSHPDTFYRIFVASFVLFDSFWTTHIQKEFYENKQNIVYGISVDWKVLVWSYHDTLYDVLNHCRNVSDLENYAMQQYAYIQIYNDDTIVKYRECVQDDSESVETCEYPEVPEMLFQTPHDHSIYTNDMDDNSANVVDEWDYDDVDGDSVTLCQDIDVVLELPGLK